MTFDQYKYIIWDWNGTLLNDGWLCVDIINTFLKNRKLPTVNFEQYKNIFGFPIIDYYRRLGLDFENESFEQLAHHYVEIYYRRVSECQLHDGSVELLQHFQKRNIGQSVLSAAHRKNLQQMVRHFKIENYFDFITGLDDHYASGKVELGKQLLEQLNQKPADVLFIGDTTHDFEVAEALRTNCVLIAQGHHAKQRLQTCGAPVFSSFRELL